MSFEETLSCVKRCVESEKVGLIDPTQAILAIVGKNFQFLVKNLIFIRNVDFDF